MMARVGLQQHSYIDSMGVQQNYDVQISKSYRE